MGPVLTIYGTLPEVRGANSIGVCPSPLCHYTAHNLGARRKRDGLSPQLIIGMFWV